MIFLIQDSQGTSSVTAGNIKTVVRATLRRLSAESTDFKFALAKYANSRRMSCFGSADETISYINNEYQYGGSGLNRLNLALSEMVLKQFEKRRGDRKTDTAKVRFTFGPNCGINTLSGIHKEDICILTFCVKIIVTRQELAARQQILNSKVGYSRTSAQRHLRDRGRGPFKTFKRRGHCRKVGV